MATSEPVLLTDEDNVEEITHILNQEYAVRTMFQQAQHNAEQRMAELHTLGRVWWDNFMTRHGLEQTDQVPQFRLRLKDGVVDVVPYTDAKAQMSQDTLDQIVEELRRRRTDK